MDLRIPIIDDSEPTRRTLATILRSHDWTVCGEAENGLSGVKKFQELESVSYFASTFQLDLL